MAQRKLKGGPEKKPKKLKGLLEKEEPGKLTDQETETVMAWLQERAGEDLPCPVCSHEAWLIGDLKGRLPAPHPLGGPAYPFVVLLCMNCAHTLFFNAIVMGVEPKAEDSDDA